MKSFLKEIQKLKPEVFVFLTLTVFYLLLWFINPGNKIILASFFVLILVLNYRIRDFRLSLAIAYITSLLIFTGKTYLFQIIPPGVFPRFIYPEGNVLFFIITPQNILSVILGSFLIRDIFINGLKKLHFEKIDLFALLFFIWPILSDSISQFRPDISILFSLQALLVFVAYIYFKNYIPGKIKGFTIIFLAIFASQILFESVVSIQQFFNNAPVVKNIEMLVNSDPEFFSNASDDTGYRYRPAGTLPHTNHLAMRMSFYLLVLMPFLFKKNGKIFLYPFLIGVVTLMLTLSRSAWIGFGLGTFFCLWVIEKIKKVKPPDFFSKNFLSLGILAIVLIFAFVLPRVESSLYTFSEGGWSLRSKQVEDTVRLIAQYPIFGVGTGMNILGALMANPQGVFSKEALSVHNWFLLTATENGIPTLLFFLTFLIYKIRQTSTSILKRLFEQEDFLKLGIISGVISLLTVGIFQPFIDSGLILLSFAILGSKQNEKYY